MFLLESAAPRVRATIIALALALASPAACTPAPSPASSSTATSLTAAERDAIADTIRARITTAANLSAKDVVASLMSLYPDTGRVISASAGHITTSRDSLALDITAFWRNIGQNMRDPRWEWGPMYIDVLAPDAAVLTATYRIPHITPQGHPHIVGGAWTAVFQRRAGKWVIVQEHLSDFVPIG
jgi:ketosteroid isomerase-like protein